MNWKNRLHLVEEDVNNDDDDDEDANHNGNRPESVERIGLAEIRDCYFYEGKERRYIHTALNRITWLYNALS